VITASAGVWLAVLGSGAGPAEPVVRWEAPPECGTARELEERVMRQLGALEAGIEIVGRVRRDGGLYALELELVVGAERQRRSFSAVDCRTLLDAAVLVSSAALGPSAVVPEPDPVIVPEPGPVVAPEPEPEPTATPEPTIAPSPDLPIPPRARPGSTPTELEPSTRSPRPGRWLLSTRVGIGHDGTLAVPVGSLGFGRAWPRWRVQALVDAFGGQAHGPRGALDLRVVTVSPRACATIRMRAWVELSPCAGMTAGPAVGRGRGVPNARTAVVPWLAAHLDFGVRVIPRPWLAVGLELSNYAMLGRPLFVLSDQRTVYRAGAAGSRAFLTVELRFSATEPAAAGH
jgi:hypothetical protein